MKTFFHTRVTCAAHVSKSIKKWKCTPSVCAAAILRRVVRCSCVLWVIVVFIIRNRLQRRRRHWGFSPALCSITSRSLFLFLFPFRICFLLPLIWLKWSKHRNLGKLYFVILFTRRQFRMREWVSESVCVCVDDRSTVPCARICDNKQRHDTNNNKHTQNQRRKIVRSETEKRCR